MGTDRLAAPLVLWVLLGFPGPGPALAGGPGSSAVPAQGLGDLEAAGMFEERQPAERLEDPGADGPPAKKCVTTSTEARARGYGYDHLVHLRNECDRAMRCTVRTDANPAPAAVTVEARGETSVVTFRGSPARSFRADVSCKPARSAR